MHRNPGPGTVCDAVVHGVPDHAAPAEVRDRRHQLVVSGGDGVVKVEPPDAGLDHGVGHPPIDLRHAVHQTQADQHRSAYARSGPPVAVVPPLAVRPEGDAVLVGRPHHRLHLLGSRPQHRRGGRVVVPVGVRVGVAVLPQRLLARQDALRWYFPEWRTGCRGRRCGGEAVASVRSGPSTQVFGCPEERRELDPTTPDVRTTASPVPNAVRAWHA